MLSGDLEIKRRRRQEVLQSESWLSLVVAQSLKLMNVTQGVERKMP